MQRLFLRLNFLNGRLLNDLGAIMVSPVDPGRSGLSDPKPSFYTPFY